ncbi:MAG: hypothetical protein QME40_01860 [bacterium]|nr:hypothetical protein [bacterium]
MELYRYKESIKHWEILNEPDITVFWKGTVEKYVELLEATYKTIREICPEGVVISAGLDGHGENISKG